MNCSLCNPVDFEFDAYSISTGTTAMAKNEYATAPVIAFQSLFQQPNEEELHTSFEEAISNRVLIVNRQLSRISKPLDSGHSIQSQLAQASRQQGQTSSSILLGKAVWLKTWQLYMLLVSFVLLLVMLGFDVMGLLVLHAH